MPILSAENNFRRGLAALVDDNHSDAAVFFGRAMDIEQQRNVRQRKMRYLSYYGLSLAKARRAPEEAIDACLRAVGHDPKDAELYLNLGHVYALAGKTTRALKAFAYGLRLAPDHRQLLEQVTRLERRRPPILRRLDRDHLLNRWLGRLRAGAAPR